jgi:hypothetical protein
LVGADAALISAALTSDHSMPAQQPIYGSGDAAQRIALTITGA